MQILFRTYQKGTFTSVLTSTKSVLNAQSCKHVRYYDSDVVRFLSLDPLASKFPALSTYVYVADNPVVLVDPNGKKPLPVLNILSPSWASQKGFYVHQQANDRGTSYLFEKGKIDLVTAISLFILGVGLHAIQDATSPVHGGFQQWTGEESDLDEVNHVIQEYSYPGINSNLQKVTNDFLELFFSKKDLPDTNIFDYIQIDKNNEELKGTD
ncbi:RHS repeat-associated core domain-containing protein [Fluviicola sp.]|uniref:RHS repeat-associated core domain-containing protein n=1 Tax=Fluviicola sp. TaxID=1917219 RepID=UPI003D2651A6